MSVETPSTREPSRRRSVEALLEARFGLRSKLALGFGGLLALLLAGGIYSITLLDRLGGSIDVILRENYESVVACEQMKDALERLDSAALFALAGDGARGAELAAANRPRFEKALATELGNVTLPGEGALARRLQQLYASYRPAHERFLQSDEPLAARRAVYFGTLLPLFQQIRTTADSILDLNQRNMLEANARARRLAAEARRRTLLLLLFGTVTAAAFVAFLSRAMLLPLRRLTASAREIESGNLDLVVPVTSRDELGQLAAAFNAMATSLRELRRSSRARLLRAQRTLQLAIDSLPDAVAVLTPNGASGPQVELANRIAISTLGLRPGEPVPERHAEWLQPLLEEAMRSGTLSERGHEAAVQLFAEGRERFYLPRAVAARDERAQTLSITLILADVTDLRRLEEMRSGLLSTVSHELRTPLTSLQMALHILLDERLGALTPGQTELLVGAREDSARLSEILASLLEIARLEDGRSLLRSEAVSPRDFVEEGLADFRAELADAGLRLEVEIDPSAPAVHVDPARGRLVLANLLTNALHHTPAGGAITVRAERVEPPDPSANGSAVRFTVADTGRGIPAEHLGRIFEKFYQVPDTGVGGAGLGLSIAREIVLAHGGDIGVESRVGAGTTFWFTLPAAAPATQATPANPATEARGPQPPAAALRGVIH
ncbi:MAG TPA: ATP-binding protein [Thermoanaerobaculia bacterium]